ncbi:MAG: ribosome biogenesis/translation initiation ATPase RLI [Candidatus Aenigmatarchaeota archaeon]
MIQRIAVIDKEILPKDSARLNDFNNQIIRICPINRSGQPCITVDKDTGFPVIDENLCIGCSLCVKFSDKAGYYAISIVNLPHELQESPVNRFGVNGFVMYRLPFPMKNEIVGIVGPNGSGKTTSLRILVGEIKPNLGSVGNEVPTEELIKLFRGTELQSYLENLKKGSVRISYKPQRVDEIPNFHKGTVRKLLEKADGKKKLDELVEIFGLKEIMERDIDQISGGELQKVAIAATLLKDADIYYFDEPTSFLDAFQRLYMARTIRSFCEGKSAIIADHDLATLDFLADRIHIFYGSPSVYGVVSKPYGVRVGINTFLEGYIKEDNVRIRKEPIKFFSSIQDKIPSSEVMISFGDLEKSFEGFNLKIQSGNIRKKEVLAVLGANGLGKTTFAKILAGEIKPDKGSVDIPVKISYKPQYLKSASDQTVKELISKYGDVENEVFKSEIVRPLQLEKLFEKNLSHLSGGELQRVSIAVCLSQPADIYLLDEPSAFLDVEQRLEISRLINKLVEVNEKSAIVIDHDLLFLSQIGTRAMVFLGESSKRGYVEEITSTKNAFNKFLSQVGVTFRKDPQTGRPRANKLNSQLDAEQKESKNYFYV